MVYAPFKDGKPTGELRDFLIGFVSNAETAEVYGRPVSVTVLAAAKMILVVDDSGDKIWALRPRSAESF